MIVLVVAKVALITERGLDFKLHNISWLVKMTVRLVTD